MQLGISVTPAAVDKMEAAPFLHGIRCLGKTVDLAQDTSIHRAARMYTTVRC